ncbi:MAG: mannose-1-phosphate guanylyltransferase [Firmicutes bacterium]|nr:mannose-1-phosphate guanylyltransferase [Bacillota bacterium]
MKTEIRYIELKTGYADNGPAWIGKVKLSKTGRTIYFNDKAFSKSLDRRYVGDIGNHFDIETGEIYWISCVKKDRTDRHWAGSGTITIQKSVVDDYLKTIGLEKLTSNYQIIDIPEIYPLERITALENKKINS